MWYLDCFSYQKTQMGSVSREFPCNSYSSKSLDTVLKHAKISLGMPSNGIDRIEISRQTKGQNVYDLDKE